MSQSEKIMEIFEQLATTSHQRANIDQLINDELGELKGFLLRKDAYNLKAKLSNNMYLADTGKVTSI